MQPCNHQATVPIEFVVCLRYSLTVFTCARVKFRARNLFLCRHFANSSDRLFKDDLLFAFNKHSFSSRQRGQFFPPAVYAGTRFSIDHLMSKSLSFHFNFQTYFDNSVSFSYLASLNDFL